ncbi:FAD/NAD-P-binding domain-containing protein [Amylostereum chailletii]|nr:FAD/NAD-P-binding domain-containing protein [Amylostereum chailletii]
MPIPVTDARSSSVGIIGAGPAGLITAHTFLQDGFKNVQVLTRDQSVGGTWMRGRVYPGLVLNNVHGEYRFSPMPTKVPHVPGSPEERLTGDIMTEYFEEFAETFGRLVEKIRFGTEVLAIQRGDGGRGWRVRVKDLPSGVELVLEYDKIVVCTGGASKPKVPESLGPSAANAARFNGLVLHSAAFAERLDDLLTATKPTIRDGKEDPASVVIAGGGKSAQDIAAYLANEGRKVTVVFQSPDRFFANAKPLPDFIRKSRILSILSPHVDLQTRLERFIHTTWLGAKIAHGVFDLLSELSFSALGVPGDSPLRNAYSAFWSIRFNDEGCPRPNSFFSLVNEGKIELISPSRVDRYGKDPHTVVLNNGAVLQADALVLATGYGSSWADILDGKIFFHVGLKRHAPQPHIADVWNYTSLANPPPAHPAGDQWCSSIYRGLVPVNSLPRRDFAVNGAMFTIANGYIFEASAHWISSYFLEDKMRLPVTPEEAYAATERNAAWIRRRWPDMLLWTNESYSGSIAFFTWPQVVDELLNDIGVKSMRSGGNWLTWPFKIVSVAELANVKEERDANRARLSLMT